MNGEYPYCKTEPFMDELKKPHSMLSTKMVVIIVEIG